MRRSDRHLQTANAGQRSARHDDLIQGEEGLAGLIAAARMDRGMKGHSIFDSEVARDQLRQHAFQAVCLDLGEEPYLAQVHTQERNIHLRHRARRPQEGAVATQDYQCPGPR